MIRLRRSGERHCLHSGGQDLWLTFYPSQASDPLANGFCSLMTLNEGFLEPEGNMLTYSRRGSRTITYVIEGTLCQKNQSRTPRLISAGDFQCSSSIFSDCSIHSNASRREPLHVLQLSLFSNQPPRASEPQQKAFPAPSRAGHLRLVASADGREGSLTLDQDVQLYSGILGATQTSVFSIEEGRVAWLHVLRGAVNVGAVPLSAGDGAGFTSMSELSLLASTDAEIILLDLNAQTPLASRFLRSARDDRADAPSSGLAAASRLGTSHVHPLYQ